MRKIFLLSLLIFPCLLSGCVFDLSPTGQQVVFISTRSKQLEVMHTDGTRRRIIPNSTEAISPAWSPDGKSILFKSKSRRTFLYNVATGKNTPVAMGATDRTPYPLVWHPSGRLFVTVESPQLNPSSRKRNICLVWRQAPNGEEKRRVFLPSAIFLLLPQPFLFLPGTEEVAYISEEHNSKAGENLYVTAGKQVKALTTTGDVVSMGISAAKNRVYWARLEKKPMSALPPIFARDLTTGAVSRQSYKRDVRLPGWNRSRKWYAFECMGFSPDATQIVLIGKVRDKSHLTAVCYRMNLDGSNVRELFRSERIALPDKSKGKWPVAPWIIPRWSHDSKKLGLSIGGHESKKATLVVYDELGRRKVLAEQGK